MFQIEGATWTKDSKAEITEMGSENQKAEAAHYDKRIETEGGGGVEIGGRGVERWAKPRS